MVKTKDINAKVRPAAVGLAPSHTVRSDIYFVFVDHACSWRFLDNDVNESFGFS